MKGCVSRQRTAGRVLLLMMAMGGVVTLLGPAVLALYWQTQGGMIIAPAWESTKGGVAGGVSFADGSLLRSVSRARMDGAIEDLQTSLRFGPGNSQTYLLLGRAYLMATRPDEAVQAYESYTRIRPRNPLGNLELAFAYEVVCKRAALSTVPSSACQDALREWRAGGLDPSRFVTLGERAFGQHQWREAADWWSRARMARGPGESQSVPTSFLFKETVASALAQSDDLPAALADLQLRDPAFQVYQTKDSTMISGTGFRWMGSVDGPIKPGTPLSYSTDGTMGVFWWSGQALVLLYVLQDGTYSVSWNLRNSIPAPVEMAYGLDGEQTERIVLDAADNSWSTVSTVLDMTKGYHSLDLWFLNNGIVNEKDRDGAVQSVMISPLK